MRRGGGAEMIVPGRGTAGCGPWGVQGWPWKLWGTRTRLRNRQCWCEGDAGRRSRSRAKARHGSGSGVRL